MALRMSLTGEPIGAETALRAGLVTEIVEQSALVQRAQALAAAMAGDGSAAVRALLAGYRRVQAAPTARDAAAAEAESWTAWRRHFAPPTEVERRALVRRNRDERERLRGDGTR
jgi:enoyl-CoA hydratase